jgi:hypothetical protein
MTCPAPIVNLNGLPLSRLLSNFDPSEARVPV